MGVALILAPLMLIIFLFPVFYIVVFVIIRRIALDNLSGKKKILVSVSLTVIFLFGPAKMVWDFVKFSNACHRPRSVISVEPIKEYLDSLPENDGLNIKVNAGISKKNGTQVIYFAKHFKTKKHKTDASGWKGRSSFKSLTALNVKEKKR